MEEYIDFPTLLASLNDDDLKGEDLEREIKRADAMKDIAKQIIDSAALVLKATELNAEYGKGEAPRILTGDVVSDDTVIKIGTR